MRLWGKSDSVLDQGKLFDAFVSYSGKDDAFVQQMLATNLVSLGRQTRQKPKTPGGTGDFTNDALCPGTGVRLAELQVVPAAPRLSVGRRLRPVGDHRPGRRGLQAHHHGHLAQLYEGRVVPLRVQVGPPPGNAAASLLLPLTASHS